MNGTNPLSPEPRSRQDVVADLRRTVDALQAMRASATTDPRAVAGAKRRLAVLREEHLAAWTAELRSTVVRRRPRSGRAAAGHVNRTHAPAGAAGGARR